MMSIEFLKLELLDELKQKRTERIFIEQPAILVKLLRIVSNAHNTEIFAYGITLLPLKMIKGNDLLDPVVVVEASKREGNIHCAVQIGNSATNENFTREEIDWINDMVKDDEFYFDAVVNNLPFIPY